MIPCRAFPVASPSLVAVSWLSWWVAALLALPPPWLPVADRYQSLSSYFRISLRFGARWAGSIVVMEIPRSWTRLGSRTFEGFESGLPVRVGHAWSAGGVSSIRTLWQV